MNTTQDDGGPAFAAGYHPEGNSADHAGMSLRDWFAGMALQGLLASGHFTEPACDGDPAWMTTHEDPWDDETGEKIHEGRRRFDFPAAAWKCADRMLAARKEGK